ncbi:MAG TPA: family 16 glycosylhydrolase [Crenalkalicoccus sp.]|nr:family 16 glycosylhydrolase [Crenalkalicoccus sp.]
MSDSQDPMAARIPALSTGTVQGVVIPPASAAAAARTGGALDLSHFHLVWDHDFSVNHSFAPELTRVWGSVSLDPSYATLSSYATTGWPHAGMMQPPTGGTAGQGYGLYSITAKIDKGEGPGAYACLWPATDQWPGPELDLVEKQSTSNTSGYSTIHWKDPATGSDQYEVHLFPTTIDLSAKHTYALDWEADHIALYIDRQQIYSTTQHVPQDAAHGGQNECFGAGMQPWGTQNHDGSNIWHVYDMSYSSPIG